MVKKKSKPMPVTSVCDDKGMMKKYQTEDDLRTIQRAEEIAKDKSRMKSVTALAKEQMASLQKISK